MPLDFRSWCPPNSISSPSNPPLFSFSSLCPSSSFSSIFSWNSSVKYSGCLNLICWFKEPSDLCYSQLTRKICYSRGNYIHSVSWCPRPLFSPASCDSLRGSPPALLSEYSQYYLRSLEFPQENLPLGCQFFDFDIEDFVADEDFAEFFVVLVGDKFLRGEGGVFLVEVFCFLFLLFGSQVFGVTHY